MGKSVWSHIRHRPYPFQEYELFWWFAVRNAIRECQSPCYSQMQPKANVLYLTHLRIRNDVISLCDCQRSLRPCYCSQNNGIIQFRVVTIESDCVFWSGDMGADYTHLQMYVTSHYACYLWGHVLSGDAILNSSRDWNLLQLQFHENLRGWCMRMMMIYAISHRYTTVLYVRAQRPQ